jgi:hypothetical protein
MRNSGGTRGTGSGIGGTAINNNGNNWQSIYQGAAILNSATAAGTGPMISGINVPDGTADDVIWYKNGAQVATVNDVNANFAGASILRVGGSGTRKVMVAAVHRKLTTGEHAHVGSMGQLNRTRHRHLHHASSL